MSNKSNISNWGKYPVVEASIVETNDLVVLESQIKIASSIIARGNGRSYGDASLNEVVFSTKKLNKINFFDREKGIIECESGVTLAVVLDLIVPQGFFLEVTPGTKFITIGGAIAADVHGKNHHQKGCFSQSLISFRLMTDSGDIKKCSRVENKELFFQTIGGMGLTGVILSAQFNLYPISTSYISYKNYSANNLEALIKLFEEHKSEPYSVAWIDCLARGEKKGRGVFMAGKHTEYSDLPTKYVKAPLFYNSTFKLKIGFNFPSYVLSPFTIKLFNRYYYAKNKLKTDTGVVSLNSFFYPLDSIESWNKIYGKNGFIQYQCVLPIATSKAGLETILDLVGRHSMPPFLTVLKLLGPSNEESPWSFPIEGYTLAMDFKMHKGIEELVCNLDKIVRKYNGRVYLAKDAMSCKEVIENPKSKTGKFSSVQSKRLS